MEYCILAVFVLCRAVLVLTLLGLFLVFFGRSVERYQKGRIATDQENTNEKALS